MCSSLSKEGGFDLYCEKRQRCKALFFYAGEEGELSIWEGCFVIPQLPSARLVINHSYEGFVRNLMTVV